MRFCKKCNTEKPLDQFWTDKASKDGKWHICIGCARSRNTIRREGLEIEGYRRCFKCLHDKPLHKFQKDRSRRDSIGYICYSCARAKGRLHYKENLIKYMLKRSQGRAKQAGIDFNLSKEDIYIPEYCPLLNVKLEYDHINGLNAYSPSLDRIDNSRGYTKDNVWVISSKANTMKANATEQELLTFASNINKYFYTNKLRMLYLSDYDKLDAANLNYEKQPNEKNSTLTEGTKV